MDSETYQLTIQLLKKQTPILDAMLPPIRDIVDAAFTEHLGPGTPAAHLFGNGGKPTWQIQLSEYADQVVSGVSETVKELLASGALVAMGLTEDAYTALRTCAAKMRVIFSSAICVFDEDGWLPFMCKNVYSHMEDKLLLIPDALKEVSVLATWTAHFDVYHICANTYMSARASDMTVFHIHFMVSLT